MCVLGWVVLATGCDRIFQLDRIAGGDGGGSSSDATTQNCTEFGAWGLPIALTEVSSVGADDVGPALSADNTHLVFHSDRGGIDRVFESVWNPASGAFEAPVAYDLPEFQTSPVLSADGLTLWYTSYASNYNISMVRRDRVTDPFVGTNVVNFAPFASTVHEEDIAFSADMLEAVVTLNGGTARDIALASRKSIADMFDPPIVIPAAQGPSYDCCATLSPDGLGLLWEGGSPYLVHEVTRASRADAFGNAQEFGPLSDPYDDGDPQYSYDGTILVYSSNRQPDGATNDFDLYMLRRNCL
jgi:hypothetical protein